MAAKPNEKEEEYFARMEYERKKRIEEGKQRDLAGEDRQKEKELHWMKCPKCGMNLVEIDYRNIKLDKCSSCEGVWLDAGEMEQVARFEKGALDRLFGVFSRRAA